jgi:hypothetical protein
MNAGAIVVRLREDRPRPFGSRLDLEAHRRVEGDGEGILGGSHAPNPRAASPSAGLEEPLVQTPAHTRAAGIGRDADEVDVALVRPILGQEADEEPDKSAIALSDKARAREVLEPKPGNERGSFPRSCLVHAGLRPPGLQPGGDSRVVLLAGLPKFPDHATVVADSADRDNGTRGRVGARGAGGGDGVPLSRYYRDHYGGWRYYNREPAYLGAYRGHWGGR